ncbi:hypothetical protein DPMN_164079 [Dreissena polymorpha]|uniref:Uncharacterized protein n=1 Tax=Dreissena polymorpha TaxID=45954 RepID=A0A9D4EX21_DREPO|nr:hypothetical protein DPMN_164079 [Dreissena polymorpha]
MTGAQPILQDSATYCSSNTSKRGRALWRHRIDDLERDSLRDDLWKHLNRTGFNVFEQLPPEVIAKHEGSDRIAYDILYVDGRPVRDYGHDGGESDIISWNVNGLADCKNNNASFTE